MTKDHIQIRDEESGEWVWVTKETYEAREYWRQKMREYINPEKLIRGTIIIISTPDGIKNEFNDYDNRG